MGKLEKIEAELRKKALSYPGTYEEQPWGERVTKVKGKIFLFAGASAKGLTVTTPSGAIKESPELTEIEMVRKELEKEYEVLDELGRGGMAIVFKAKETELDREVAIKVLPFSLAFDKEFVERFQREARTSAKLEHPNIIPIYRVGKSGRVIYFVMKFLRGKPLSRRRHPR